jgi:isocitrate dehydrogenase (NAD+)
MSVTITLIPGDGIGPEVTGATCRLLEAAGADIEWETVQAGARAYEETGEPVPQAVFDSIRKNTVALKGPLQTPKGKGFRSANVTIRQELELYTGLRPVKSLPGIVTPYSNVDLVVLRENTEGLYSGIEHEVLPDVIISMKVSTKRAATRLAKWGFEYMRNKGRADITCCHKSSVSPLSDGAFVDAFNTVGSDYPFVSQATLPIDQLAMGLAMDPSQFDVMFLQNLNGDIISDICAGLVGGLGVVPGANIGDKMAVFEAVHGTAPDIAGKGIANPLAVMLSGVMMLEHIGKHKVAEKVNNAILAVLSEGKHLTGDLGGRANTERFTDAIIEAL